MIEVPYVSTEGLFAYDAVGEAAFDSWSAVSCLSTAGSHLWVSLWNWHKMRFNFAATRDQNTEALLQDKNIRELLCWVFPGLCHFFV